MMKMTKRIPFSSDEKSQLSPDVTIVVHDIPEQQQLVRFSMKKKKKTLLLLLQRLVIGADHFNFSLSFSSLSFSFLLSPIRIVDVCAYTTRPRESQQTHWE